MPLYNYDNNRGIIVPDTQNILKSVQDEFVSIFGAGLNLDASTKQGRIIELLAAQRKNVLGAMAFISNQLNPDYSYGSFTDAQGGFFEINRASATPSILTNVKLTGYSGTVVPAGSQASDEAGNLLSLSENVTLGSSGSASVLFNSNPSVNDTLTLGDVTYTFVSLAQAENQVQIGSDASSTAQQLAQVINGISPDEEAYTQTANEKASAGPGQVGSEVLLTSLASSGNPNDITLETTSSSISVTPFSGATTGVGYGTFVCNKTGAISIPAGTMTKIVTPVEGWETVYNGGNAKLGTDIESDYSFKQRIKNEKSKYSTSMVSSIYSALYSIEGMTGVYIYENHTNQAQQHSNSPDAPNYVIPIGESVGAHSILVIVYGGNTSSNFNDLVANAIIQKKSGGCGMSSVSNPDYSVTVSVPGSEFGTLYPITFNYAQPVPIYINATLRISSFTGSSLSESAKNVLLDYFAGNLDVSSTPNIGTSISAFEISSILSSQLGVVVTNIQIGTSLSNMGVAEIQIPITKIATTSSEIITISEVK